MMRRDMAAACLLVIAAVMIVPNADALAAKPPPGVIAHIKPDTGYAGGFKVRCATGGSVQVIKVGKTSTNVCPGAGKVDRLYVKADQNIWCKINSQWFSLFRHGVTYTIAPTQGGYRCESRRP